MLNIFWGCSSLTSVEFPAGMATIGNMAFYGCTGLTSVISHITEPFTTNSSTFMIPAGDNYIVQTSATLYVPFGCKEKYETTDYWRYFKNIVEMDKTDDDGKVPINSKTFPHEKFREWVYTNCDTDKDGCLSEEEIAATKTIFSGTYHTTIDDLTGIEYFTALEKLNLLRTRVVSLDLSNNIALKTLICSQDTYLESLDISKNVALESVDVRNTKIKSLDVSNHPNLRQLYCSDCSLLESLNCSNTQLTSLDVTGNTALFELNCGNNQLTSLDVSNNTALAYLYCNDNQLTSLDVSKNTALFYLECGNNQLSSLDVTKNTALVYLYCNGNQLTSLDVTKNTALAHLECNNNQLSSLDLSNNTALFWLWCYENQLASLDVSKNTKLERLHCQDNQLTSLDLSNNTALKDFSCFNNQLTSLDLSKNTQLEELRCWNNQLTSLDVTGNTALKEIYCYGNQIKDDAMDALVNGLPTVENGVFTVIDTSSSSSEGNVCTRAQVNIAKEKGWNVYAHTDTHDVEYAGNEVIEPIVINEENFPDANFRALVASSDKDTNLDGSLSGEEIAAVKVMNADDKSIENLKGIEYFTSLQQLRCSNNQLKELDITQNTALQYLWCDGNQLTTLDVSKNTGITDLHCEDNQLITLDVSNNIALQTLSCYRNQLTALDVSKNTSLSVLYCYDNQLTSIDVSKNTLLEQLRVNDNLLKTLDVTKNTALKRLHCYRNQLTALDVSENIKLNHLYCYENQLTALDISKNTKLTNILCNGNQLSTLDASNNAALTYLTVMGNQIKGEGMDVLVNSLPTVTEGTFLVMDNAGYYTENNICTKAQVAIVKEKGWQVLAYIEEDGLGKYIDYEGSDPQTLNPLENGDNVNIGNDINSDTNLDGNVVNNVLYNISSDNRSYDATEGCLVINKSTSDDTMSALEGKDIFGEDFQGQFTGVVFKIAEGSGSVKVQAESTGTMLLKVKIGNNAPVTIELEGKLKVSFGYDVTEETNVYIYAGTPSSQAKGMRKANGDSGNALKIYGIEIVRTGPSGIDDVSYDDGLQDVYSLSGQKVRSQEKNLKGLPAGVYIVGGKKIFVK